MPLARSILAMSFVLAAGVGQLAGAEVDAAKSADQQWAVLQALGRPVSPGVKPPVAAPRSPVENAAASVRLAAQLKAFYSEYPGHAAAKEAKRLEALALSQAALNGDSSQDSRRQTLVDEIRRDPAIPELGRYEAVAWDRQVAVARQAPADHVARMAAQEGITRALIAEFPRVHDGYESLLAVARDSNPARARSILADLERMPAPAAVAEQMVVLRERINLIGQPVAAVFGPAGAGNFSTLAKGKPVILYTWSTEDKRSLLSAKRLANLAPFAALMGICLSPDSALARGTAQREKLPGEQFYDRRGPASALAISMSFDRPSLVYLIDRSGQVADVNGLVDSVAKLNRLSR